MLTVFPQMVDKTAEVFVKKLCQILVQTRLILIFHKVADRTIGDHRFSLVSHLLNSRLLALVLCFLCNSWRRLIPDMVNGNSLMLMSWYLLSHIVRHQWYDHGHFIVDLLIMLFILRATTKATLGERLTIFFVIDLQQVPI